MLLKTGKMEYYPHYIFSIMVKLNNQDPTIFKNQAGDILNLATIFINNYYGLYNVSWDTPEGKEIVIDKTFNQYLKNKGYMMV